MITLLDIGNTRTKYCTVERENRSDQYAVENKDLTTDFLTNHFITSTKLILACVSNQSVVTVIKLWCDSNNIMFEHVKSEYTKDGVISGYEQPHQLGVDRWLTLIAVARLYPNKNVLIIDAGTATTIDFITKTGHHQGGWILAGLDALVSNLLDNTSQVNANKIKKPSIAFGVNTTENVNNASWAATLGSVNLAISQISQQNVTLDEVIITGGNSRLLSSLLNHQSHVIDELVLMGLQAYI